MPTISDFCSEFLGIFSTVVLIILLLAYVHLYPICEHTVWKSLHVYIYIQSLQKQYIYLGITEGTGIWDEYGILADPDQILMNN